MTLDIDMTTQEGHIAWLEHIACTPVDEIDLAALQLLQVAIGGMLPALKAGEEVIANDVFLLRNEKLSRKAEKKIRNWLILKEVETRVANGEKRLVVELVISDREKSSGAHENSTSCRSADAIAQVVKREKRSRHVRFERWARKQLAMFGLPDSDIERLLVMLVEDDGRTAGKNIISLIVELNLSPPVADAVLAILDAERLNTTL